MTGVWYKRVKPKHQTIRVCHRRVLVSFLNSDECLVEENVREKEIEAMVAAWKKKTEKFREMSKQAMRYTYTRTSITIKTTILTRFLINLYA